MQKLVKEFQVLKSAMSKKNESLPDFSALAASVEKLEHLLVLQSYFKVNETNKSMKDFEKNYFKQFYIRLDPTSVASFLLGSLEQANPTTMRPHASVSDCLYLQEDQNY